MEALLTSPLQLWLGDADCISVVDTASITLVRDQIRAVGELSKLARVSVEQVALAATELAQNQLNHVGRGYVLIRPVQREGVSGIELVAADSGPGIARPGAALQGKTAQPAGLGSGLSSVLELMDEVDIDVRMGEGTCVWARKFNRPFVKRRQVGIYGRPHPQEAVAGDDAAFRRDNEHLWVAVADGLGHGPDARIASARAVQALASLPGAFDVVLQERNLALRETRGAAMALAQLTEAGGQLSATSLGNVSVSLWGPGVASRLSGTSFTLGASGTSLRSRLEHAALRQWDALVLFTDGVSSRADISDSLDLLWEHPIVVAEALVSRFAVQHDDALVLVAR